jgi:hypothetical protein
MIDNVAASGVHAANLSALRQNRAKKTAPAPDAVETAKAQKPAHPAHPHGHIPPGLARAADKIASKIFSRADTDASGTVTQQELSAVHSKHARNLAASDLFQAAQPPADSSTETNTTTNVETGATSDTPAETTTETPAPAGVTEAQLKEALTKFFYAKVGITYAPPAPPATEAPDPTAPTDTTTPPVVDPTSEEEASNQNFTAVA